MEGSKNIRPPLLSPHTLHPITPPKAPSSPTERRQSNEVIERLSILKNLINSEDSKVRRIQSTQDCLLRTQLSQRSNKKEIARTRPPSRNNSLSLPHHSTSSVKRKKLQNS